MVDTHRKTPPRLDRVFDTYRFPLYFVTMVSWRRQRLFNRHDVHEAFVEHARRQVEIGVAVGRYVLMPDHAHFFLRVSPDQRLGESVKHLKQAVSKVLRARDPGLRVWQPGFFDRLLRNSESYSAKWAYVRENPVRAGLVQKADEWPYQGEVVLIDRP